VRDPISKIPKKKKPGLVDGSSLPNKLESMSSNPSTAPPHQKKPHKNEHQNKIKMAGA
jgi:hypothetical protein